MKKRLIIVIVILFASVSAWGLSNKVLVPENATPEEQDKILRQSIPQIASRFIGIPYKFGGDLHQSGATDNSHLFFSIYSLAAKKAGLSYKTYLPIKYLLRNTNEINENELKNGDLMVLKDGHCAMVYQVENTGRIHLIYSSKKKQEVLSFNSDHLVFHVYWLENLKGFFRLSEKMFTPAN